MPRELDRGIEKLQNQVLAMENMVKKAIQDAVDSLIRRDKVTSRAVYESDHLINTHRFAIERECLTAIATQQPTASDLRTLASILDIAGELERMGDYAKGIARVSLMLGDVPLPEEAKELSQMAKLVVHMLEHALRAFMERDPASARMIPSQDDEVDQLFNRIYTRLVQGMIADPKTIDQASHLQWAAHNLERMADRVINICERTIFTTEGEILELDRSDDEWFPA